MKRTKQRMHRLSRKAARPSPQVRLIRAPDSIADGFFQTGIYSGVDNLRTSNFTPAITAMAERAHREECDECRDGAPCVALRWIHSVHDQHVPARVPRLS